MLLLPKGHDRDSLLPAALRDDAIHLVQPAIGARRAVLGHVTSDLTRSTALASLGSSPLHGSDDAGAIEAGSRRLALLRLRLRPVLHVG